MDAGITFWRDYIVSVLNLGSPNSFLSMKKADEGYQRISVTPLNFSGDTVIELGLDFSLVHESSQYNYWQEIKKEQCGLGAAIIGRTLTTGIRIFSGFSLDSKEVAEKTVCCDDRYIGLKCVVNLTKSEKSTLVKKVLGMRSDGELLELNPMIPEEWNSYSFRIAYRGSVLFIGIDQKSLKIRAVNGVEVSVLLYGEKRRITEKGVEFPRRGSNRT